MLLENKTAIVYGGGAAIGGAAARTFAREGARVHLTGRTPATLDAVAEEIRAAGGTADTARVEALDQPAVRQHADAVAARTGRIDIALNAIGNRHVQGTPFAELSLDDEFLAAPADRTVLHRWPTLADVAEAAAFGASDRAAATTGTTINRTAGSDVD